MRANTLDADAIRPWLSSDERVLWRGRPRQGLTFTSTDWFLIPFAILWSGIAVVGFGASAVEGELFMVPFLLPFLAIGAYMLAGRFWIDARLRSGTHYAVTDQRVIVISGGKKQSLKSLPLRTMTDVTVTERSDGGGRITFGREDSMARWYGNAAPAFGMQSAPTFMLDDGIRQVYELIRQAQIDELRAHLRT